MGDVNRSTHENGSEPRSRGQNEHRVTKKKKKHRPLPSSTSSAKPSSTALRNRIRSLTKVLSHSSRMPADVRVEKEREVASLESDLNALLATRQRKETLGKYHMVRFVERRKAERALKRWMKEGDTIEARARRREAEIDLAYAQNAPLVEKYVALFAKDATPIEIGRAGTTEEALDVLRQNKPPLWTLVEQAMDDSSLDSVRSGMHPGLKPLGLWSGRAEKSGGVGQEEEGSLDGKAKKVKSASKKQIEHLHTARRQDRAVRSSDPNKLKGIKPGRASKGEHSDDAHLKQTKMKDGGTFSEEDTEMSDGGFFEV